MGLSPILIKKEEEELLLYLENMVDLGHLVNPFQFKAKVGEMIQTMHTPFTNGIPRNLWLKWFRLENPHLILRQSKSLDEGSSICTMDGSFFEFID